MKPYLRLDDEGEWEVAGGPYVGIIGQRGNRVHLARDDVYAPTEEPLCGAVSHNGIGPQQLGTMTAETRPNLYLCSNCLRETGR